MAGLAAPVTAAAAASITPHFAVYRLSLGNSGSDVGVADARGQIEFQWAEGCDGWTVSQRTRLVLTGTEGNDFQTGWTLKAWESKDGLTYRFTVRRFESEAEPEETVGKARLEGPGQGGLVSYSEPEARQLDLPKGTVFPTRHSMDLLAAASRKDLLLWRMVFDGAGEEGLFGVNAAFARSIPAETPPAFESELIKGVASWRMRLAYFDAEGQGAEPEHEQSQRIYANGVVDEVRFEYPDFALDASLERLEELPRPDCN